MLKKIKRKKWGKNKKFKTNIILEKNKASKNIINLVIIEKGK